uniref:Uncharacterized protein n=1 Tax=Mycena chlorophos TaxID=658473 RepID=A0ABQ0LDG7_MYCCL|nr:predicted protein [Mycena chlorophos]
MRNLAIREPPAHNGSTELKVPSCAMLNITGLSSRCAAKAPSPNGPLHAGSIHENTTRFECLSEIASASASGRICEILPVTFEG